MLELKNKPIHKDIHSPAEISTGQIVNSLLPIK
jgi:hypothetical protein